MHFSLFLLAAPMALAAGPVKRNAAAAGSLHDRSTQSACGNPGWLYCGYTLISQNPDWNGVLDSRALYLCKDAGDVDLLSACPDGCTEGDLGREPKLPPAHCN